MKKILVLAFVLSMVATCDLAAQARRGGQRGRQPDRIRQNQDDQQSGSPSQRGNRGGASSQRGIDIDVENPLPIGETGVAWYTTWESGHAEAQRSNRPIFFMSAATTCSGVPGVF